MNLDIESTMPTTGEHIVMGDDRTVPLALQPDSKLTGSFVVDKKGFYRIELEGPNKEAVAASPTCTVDVIEDMAPTVKFVKPGVTPRPAPSKKCSSKRAPMTITAMASMDLVCSVNGGDERPCGCITPAIRRVPK